MQISDLDTVREALIAREPIFHRREFGTRREDLLNMTANDFWEIGASGQAYSRAFVIETLLERYQTPEPNDWSCSDFTLRQIAADLYQLNYILQQPTRQTRRTTLWRQTGDAWQIVFHQGTVIA